jgi:hypothetical protein
MEAKDIHIQEMLPMLSSGDSFPHLIQKPRSQLGFVTYLLNPPRTFVVLYIGVVCVTCSLQYVDHIKRKPRRFVLKN